MLFRSKRELPDRRLTNGPINPIPTTSNIEIKTKSTSKAGIRVLKEPNIKWIFLKKDKNTPVHRTHPNTLHSFAQRHKET